MTAISIRDLLHAQIIDGKFDRVDLAVRILALEEYLGENDYGFALYNKMQLNRVKCKNKKKENAYRKLIASMLKSGFSKKHPIICGPTNRIIDGAHRVSISIHQNIDVIYIKNNPKSKHGTYGLQWFINKGFTDDEITNIRNKMEEILQNYFPNEDIAL